MGKRKKTSTVEPAPSRSKTSSPAKGGGSSPKQNLTKEDQARVIAELQRKLDATSKPKGKRPAQRSAIGAADSTTDEDDPPEASEKAADDAEPASRSKSGSTSEKYSKLGNRASKARKLFKDKDEEVEFRAWKASKAAAVEAVPVPPPGPVQSDEAVARFVFLPFFTFLLTVFPRSRYNFTKAAVLTILKFQFMDKVQDHQLMIHIGVPPERVTKGLIAKYKQRYRQRLCQHFTLLRNVIAEATGVEELKGTAKMFNEKSNADVIAACQAKAPWDVVKEPYDVIPFQAGEDPFGSEIFANLVRLWGEMVYPAFREHVPTMTKLPPIEQLVLISRMVIFSCFVFSCDLAVFFYRCASSGELRPRATPSSPGTSTSRSTSATGTCTWWKRQQAPTRSRSTNGTRCCNPVTRSSWRASSRRSSFPRTMPRRRARKRNKLLHSNCFFI